MFSKDTPTAYVWMLIDKALRGQSHEDALSILRGIIHLHQNAINENNATLSPFSSNEAFERVNNENKIHYLYIQTAKDILERRQRPYPI